MSGSPSRPVRLGGTSVGQISVACDGDIARLSFSVEPGHLPRAAREALVSAAFNELASRPACRVQAALPLGDVDLLTALTRRLSHPTVRAAGHTCLLDATLPT